MGTARHHWREDALANERMNEGEFNVQEWKDIGKKSEELFTLS